jgi:hypothetical protein
MDLLIQFELLRFFSAFINSSLMPIVTEMKNAVQLSSERRIDY